MASVAPLVTVISLAGSTRRRRASAPCRRRLRSGNAGHRRDCFAARDTDTGRRADRQGRRNRESLPEIDSPALAASCDTSKIVVPTFGSFVFSMWGGTRACRSMPAGPERRHRRDASISGSRFLTASRARRNAPADLAPAQRARIVEHQLAGTLITQSDDDLHGFDRHQLPITPTSGARMPLLRQFSSPSSLSP